MEFTLNLNQKENNKTKIKNFTNFTNLKMTKYDII